MRYVSTRNNSKEYNFEEVFIKGLADDGGLYVPKSLKKYFVEIDCFCYKKQTLLAGEKSTYSITFYIDPKMINDSERRNLNSMDISYTFLDSKNG